MYNNEFSIDLTPTRRRYDYDGGKTFKNLIFSCM